MTSINQVSNVQTVVASSTTKKPVDATDRSQTSQNKTSEQVIYDTNNEQVEQSSTFKPDMEKVKAMKAETDQRMIELFTGTVSKGHLKQLGGLRGILDKILKGEKIEGIEISFTDEDIQKAKADIAPDGYWSPEKTSDRFIDFAKALSGGDPSKADMLLKAFKKGYKEAEKLWGGELPEISKKTYELTLEKFDNWANSEN
ncbi:MAG: hypothetical protein CVV02_05560 [Firmicutes bacterium HGW-Firmicutes-7]|nr:MAG: hypothetical protein CVV02_05560 [Firmicutes bacterium HGW-Firmicutes-7]